MIKVASVCVRIDGNVGIDNTRRLDIGRTVKISFSPFFKSKRRIKQKE
jgi:hypothetical protein